MIWDGARWKVDNTLHAFDLARCICREAAAEAAATLDRPRIAAAVAGANTVAAVARLARADRRIAATVEQWDADPWLLNTPAGVVDLRTGKAHPHRADGYMTKIAAVAPGGECSRFRAFLERIAGGDAELVAYLHRASSPTPFADCLSVET